MAVHKGTANQEQTALKFRAWYIQWGKDFLNASGLEKHCNIPPRSIYKDITGHQRMPLIYWWRLWSRLTYHLEMHINHLP